MKKEKWVQICPKCKSQNIHSDMSAGSIGMGTFQNKYECSDCGYSGSFFPKIKQNEVNEYKIKSKVTQSKKKKITKTQVCCLIVIILFILMWIWYLWPLIK